MWLLAPDLTWWFAPPKGRGRLRLRQATLAELQFMQAQEMSPEQRLLYLLAIGIVGAEDLRDHEGQPVDFDGLLVPRGDIPTPRDRVLPAEICRRIPNHVAQAVSIQIAQGPQTEDDEGN